MKIFGTAILIAALHFGAIANSINPLGEIEREKPVPVRDAKTEARIEVLQNRLKEINEMDLKHLEKAEKSEVKKELREIRRELKAYNASGIYISIGGLLIIVLLLILLL